MSRQLLAALVLLLSASSHVRAQNFELALGELEWGMTQAALFKHKNNVSGVGPDTALLRNQPALRRNEAVLSNRDAFSRSFYFFRNGKLWKVYVALEPTVFPEGNYAAFIRSLEKRLGPAKAVHGALAPGVTRQWSEWQQGHTRLRALDETQHLGCYALIYEQALASARK